MSEFRPFLDREAQEIDPQPGAFDGVLRRAERRRSARRVATAVVALVLAGGGIGLAYATLGPDRGGRPTGQPVDRTRVRPVPGPTHTPRANVVPGLVIGNQSSVDGAAEFAIALLASDGIEADLTLLRAERKDIDVTTINCHPARESDALALQDAYFPGAELHPRIDPDSVLISVGNDFIESNRTMFANFIAVRSFMTRRVEGAGAEAFLSDEAAREFATGGLSLYDYAVGGAFAIQALHPSEEDGAVADVLVFSSAKSRAVAMERLTVGDLDPEDGTPEILAAELTEDRSGGAIGPGADDVESFVEAFLRARRSASGAGTYLGADARRAYASHEDGLDLLGYAAGDALTKPRVVRYDKLSPVRHRVVVRFALTDSTGRRVVWETLLIGWRQGNVFTVLNVERGRPG